MHVYIRGRWVPIEEAYRPPSERRRIYRRILTEEVVRYVLSNPKNSIRKSVILRLARKSADEAGLPFKRPPWRFLLKEGVLVRPPGSKCYMLGDAAKPLVGKLTSRG